METYRVYKPSLLKRITGAAFVLIWGGALIALVVRMATQGHLPSDEFWSGVGIGVFLLFLVLLGLALYRSRFELGDQTLRLVDPFRARTIQVADLGGFGKLLIVATAIPIVQMRLYNPKLKEVTRFTVNLADQASVEAWLLKRLPVVVDDGSPAFPKPRLRDSN